MRLDDWLKENRYNGKEFGQMVGVSNVMISLVRHDKRKPSPTLIARISEATGGQVTEKDFEAARNEFNKDRGQKDAERV